MCENDPGKTDKQTATENKPLSPLSEVEDEKEAQRELDPLQNNQLEDIGNKSGIRGHKADPAKTLVTSVCSIHCKTKLGLKV